MAGWFEAVLPVASAALGAAGGFGGLWFTQSRQDRREREAREHERTVAAVSRREEYELQTLNEVHGLLRAHVDTVQQCEFLDANRVWGAVSPQIEALKEKREDAREAWQTARWQVEFILSDEVREKVSRAVGDVGVPRTLVERPGVTELFGRAARQEEVALAAFDAIAARVREIYAGREAIEPR